MFTLPRSLLFALLVAPVFTVSAASSGMSSSPKSYGGGSSISRSPPESAPGAPIHPLTPKPLLPRMATPFEMPGVVGWENDKWVGADFLGYLSSNITVVVEIRTTADLKLQTTEAELEAVVGELFKKANLNPQAEVKEGPPLPFLHILVFVYPVQKDHFVIMAHTRLFEHIQVIRKDFVPAGYWQAITWEGHGIDLTTSSQLDTQLKTSVEKVTDMFTKRYWEYNKKTNLPK